MWKFFNLTKRCLSAGAVIALAGCGQVELAPDAVSYLGKYGVDDPTPSHFVYCRDHGCQGQVTIGLDGDEWRQLGAVFESPPTGAAAERARIASAVGIFERMSGAKAGTAGDIGQTFPGFGRAGQLDCVDETVNTTTLLVMMERAGLLRWHRLRRPAGRGQLIDRWPHRTAVVTERESGAAYAVDSWFRDNGEPAEVVPLKAWLDGWSPD